MKNEFDMLENYEEIKKITKEVVEIQRNIKKETIFLSESLKKLDKLCKAQISYDKENLPKDKSFLNQPIDNLVLRPRTYYALKRAGIDYVFELANKSENELLCIKGIGITTIQEIENALK